MKKSKFTETQITGALKAYILTSIQQAQEEINIWMEDYNNHHPHGSLGDKPPAEYVQEVFSNSRETD